MTPYSFEKFRHHDSFAFSRSAVSLVTMATSGNEKPMSYTDLHEVADARTSEVSAQEMPPWSTQGPPSRHQSVSRRSKA